ARRGHGGEPDPMSRTPMTGVRVGAAATTANLGPGFDAAGVALAWWDTLEAVPAPQTTVLVAGERAELIPTGPENLVRRAMALLAAEAGTDPPPLALSRVKGFPLGCASAPSP